MLRCNMKTHYRETDVASKEEHKASVRNWQHRDLLFPSYSFAHKAAISTATEKCDVGLPAHMAACRGTLGGHVDWRTDAVPMARELPQPRPTNHCGLGCLCDPLWVVKGREDRSGWLGITLSSPTMPGRLLVGTVPCATSR